MTEGARHITIAGFHNQMLLISLNPSVHKRKWAVEYLYTVMTQQKMMKANNDTKNLLFYICLVYTCIRWLEIDRLQTADKTSQFQTL